MIDIENLIVNKVYNAVHATYPNARVESTHIEAASAFPTVCVVEDDNYTHRATQDGSLEDHAVNVMYSISVFTNDSKRKATAKAIASIVDEVMLDNLFTRTTMMSVPNIDRTIYRIEMRYEAVVAAPVDDGDGNLTFQMYRR